MIFIKLLEPGSIDDQNLSYVVMGSRYRDQWIFVRHRDRQTWEMPAGHIEPGESADQAAVRELFEEAGVLNSRLEIICDYSVTVGAKTEYGRFYGAFVNEMEAQQEFEIAELLLSDKLPRTLTYPEVQTILFKRLEAYFLSIP